MYKMCLIHIRRLLVSFLLFPVTLFSQQQECFLLMVGKDASVNGQVLLAHNNDLSGIEASMLRRVPADEKIKLLPDSSHAFKQNYEMLVLQTNIGFTEGDAVAINEHGVAVAGGLALNRDRNSRAKKLDPLVSSGLGGGVRYFALKHAKTARECVKIIGELYKEYGISYPSGVGIADTSEVWYMEAGGGHAWAAIRVPNDSYLVAANSYRIGTIDYKDTINFICSSKLIELCKAYDFKNKSKKAFNFRAFFGNGFKERLGNNYYNTRRLWRAIDILNPSMQLSPDEEVYPLFIKPETKLKLQDCFRILRDCYSETQFDIFKHDNLDNPERSIAVWDCVHTDVITLSPGKPTAYGCVLWTGLSSPFTAVYTPVYFGSKTIPTGFDMAPSDFNKHSAFWVFKKLGNLCQSDYPIKMKAWLDLRNQYETRVIEAQSDIIHKAEIIRVKYPKKLPSYLDKCCEDAALKALKLAYDMIDSLEFKNETKDLSQ